MSKYDKSYYLRNKTYHQAYSKQWALDNPDKVRAASRRHEIKKRTDNPRKHYGGKIFRERRRVAGIKGIPFEITLDYVMGLACDVCPILGIELEWGTASAATASLDRIIPELGYVNGNVHWISWRANTLKNSATKEESEKLHDWFQRL